MALHSYTKEEEERAQEYLRKRLENEVSMEHDVEKLLGIYVELFADFLMRGLSVEEWTAYVDELIEQLLEDCELLAVDEHTDKRDAIIAFFMRDWKGENLRGRVSQRVGTFVGELAAVVLAGRLLGKGKNEIVRVAKESLSSPWQCALLVEARNLIRKGDLKMRKKMAEMGVDEEELEEKHYGRGVAVSSIVALQRMLRFAISEAWMFYDYQIAKENGAIGFIPRRGSNIPCYICDEHADVFHYMNEARPLYHLNCLCYVYYVYNQQNK